MAENAIILVFGRFFLLSEELEDASPATARPAPGVVVLVVVELLPLDVTAGLGCECQDV